MKETTASDNADDTALIRVINESESITGQLARGQQLTPAQSRSIVQLIRQISPGEGIDDTADRDMRISEYSKKLRWFTDILRMSSSKQPRSPERVKSDVQNMTQLLEGFLCSNLSDASSLEAQAMLRGARTKMNLLMERQGCLNGAELAELLGVERNTPRKQFERGRVLAVRTGGKLRYPLWQLVESSANSGDYEILPGIAAVIDVARSAGAIHWDIFSFFLTENIHLDEESNERYRTPIDALKDGQEELVVDVARMTFMVE